MVAVGGLLLLGIPGAAVLEVAMAVVRRVSDLRLKPDQAWPAAIMVSGVGPFALVPGSFAAARMVGGRWPRVLLTAALGFAIAVVGTVAWLLTVLSPGR